MSENQGNVIQIKRGEGEPKRKLAPYELGYDTSNNYLYIGQNDADAEKIKAGFADSANYAKNSEKIVDANKNLKTVGSSTEPIYLLDGEFLKCGGATISGTIEYARSLQPGAKIQADLEADNPIIFDGTQDIVIGTKGVLPISKGGTGVSNLKSLMLDMIYPVGSIYLSLGETSPDLLFGGTWEKLEGRFLLGSSNDYTINTTGGEATHTLTASEIPDHTHTLKIGSTDNTGSYSTQQLHPGKEGKTVYETKNPSVGSGGDDKAHNNMPPYLVVNMWKRTE